MLKLMNIDGVSYYLIQTNTGIMERQAFAADAGGMLLDLKSRVSKAKWRVARRRYNGARTPSGTT